MRRTNHRTTYIARFQASLSVDSMLFLFRSDSIMLLSIHQVTAHEVPFTLRSTDGGIMSAMPRIWPSLYAATLNFHVSRKFISVPRVPSNLAFDSSMLCTWASCVVVPSVKVARRELVTPTDSSL